MADYTKQIFEMLGVEPGEEFRVIGGDIDGWIFRITSTLGVQYKSPKNNWCYSDVVNIRSLLLGYQTVIKILHPTAEEKLAIDYARACGCKWIAKDENGDNFAYIGKPEKYYAKSWRNPKDLNVWMKIYLPISFIHWEDEEPYYIGNKE